MVHSALERAPLPLGVEGPLERLHAAGQLVEARVVDDQDAVEVVELVLEGLGLGLGLLTGCRRGGRARAGRCAVSEAASEAVSKAGQAYGHTQLPRQLHNAALLPPTQTLTCLLL